MVTDKHDPKRPAGALALPVSRIPDAWRPLYCVLAHLSQHVGGDAQHALTWLAVHAAWPSGLVEVGIRRLVAVSGMADHAMRAALTDLDKNGWAPIEGHGAHGVYRRRIRLCDGCQRGNIRHAGVWFSVAMSYTLEPGRQNGQRGNRCHETEELQGEPSATPVRTRSRPAAASPNGDGGERHAALVASPRSTNPPWPGNPGGRVPSDPSGRVLPAGRTPVKPSKEAREASTATHPGTTATHPAAGAIVPFQARPPAAGARAGAARAGSRQPPGATTGDPALHPGLFEPEAEHDPARWAR